MDKKSKRKAKKPIEDLSDEEQELEMQEIKVNQQRQSTLRSKRNINQQNSQQNNNEQQQKQQKKPVLQLNQKKSSNKSQSQINSDKKQLKKDKKPKEQTIEAKKKLTKKQQIKQMLKVKTEQELQKLKDQYQIQNKLFNEPQCMICYDSECIYKSLSMDQDVYVCSKNIHENQYLCSQSAKNSENKCPFCRHDEIIKIDPIHRNQLKVNNQQKMGENVEVLVLKQIESFLGTKKQLILNKGQEYKFKFDELCDFKIKNTILEKLEKQYDYHFLHSIITHVVSQIKILKTQYQNKEQQKQIISKMVACMGSVVLEIIKPAFENDIIYKKIFEENSIGFTAPKETIQNITGALDTFSKYGFLKVDNQVQLQNNMPLYELNLQVVKFLTQQFLKRQNKIFIDFYFDQFLYVLNDKEQPVHDLKVLVLKYLSETFFEEEAEGLSTHEEYVKLLIPNLDKVMSFLKIDEQLEYYFPFLVETQDKKKQQSFQSPLKLLKKQYQQVQFSEVPHSLCLFLDIVLFLDTYCNNHTDYMKDFVCSIQKLFQQNELKFTAFVIVCYELSNDFVICMERFSSFNMLLTDMLNSWVDVDTNGYYYMPSQNYDFRKFLIESTEPKYIDAHSIVKFLIDYSKKLQKKNIQCFINFFILVHVFMMYNKSRKEYKRLDDNLLYILLESLLNIYINQNKLVQKIKNQEESKKMNQKFKQKFSQAIHSLVKVLNFDNLENQEQKLQNYEEFVMEKVIKDQIEQIDKTQEKVKIINGFVGTLFNVQREQFSDSEEELDSDYNSQDYDSDEDKKKDKEKNNDQNKQQQQQQQQQNQQTPFVEYSLNKYRQEGQNYVEHPYSGSEYDDLDDYDDSDILISEGIYDFEDRGNAQQRLQRGLRRVSQNMEDLDDQDDEDWVSDEEFDIGIIEDDMDEEDDDDQNGEDDEDYYYEEYN